MARFDLTVSLQMVQTLQRVIMAVEEIRVNDHVSRKWSELTAQYTLLGFYKMVSFGVSFFSS